MSLMVSFHNYVWRENWLFFHFNFKLVYLFIYFNLCRQAAYPMRLVILAGQACEPLAQRAYVVDESNWTKSLVDGHNIAEAPPRRVVHTPRVCVVGHQSRWHNSAIVRLKFLSSNWHLYLNILLFFTLYL